MSFSFHKVILSWFLLLLKFWLTSSNTTCFSRNCIIRSIGSLSWGFWILLSYRRFILCTLFFRNWFCFFFFLFFFRSFDFLRFFFLFWFFNLLFYNFLFFNGFGLFLFFLLFLRFTACLLNRSCLSFSFFFFFGLFLG